MKKNVVLIGMPGAGKSTIGVILAKMMGKDFIDADLVIQKEEGLLLKDIIKRDGPDGFLAVENRGNAGLNPANAVIATGGSVVYGEEAMRHLGEISVIVYLRLSYQAVRSRLRDVKGRGVVLRDGQTLHDLYLEREGLYEKYADITIDESGCGVEETVQKAVKAINEAMNRPLLNV